MPDLPSLLADTHIWWRWLHEPRRLSKAQSRVLALAERRNQPVAVSAISLWELAQMVARARVEVDGSLDFWLKDAAANPLIEILPITPEIAADAAQLSNAAPADPGDRLIIATARCHNLKLLTSDQRIIDWGGVAVI